MGEKFFNFFKSKKRKFQQQTKKEKQRVYQREKKTPTIYGKKRLEKKKQLHIDFNFQKKSIISFYFIGFVTSLIGLLFIFKGSYFSIQHIEIFSQDKISNINIAYNSIDSLRNKNIFQISKKSILDKLQIYQKNIKEISIEKKLPDTLKVQIHSFPPVFYITYNTQKYILTANGIAIKQKNTPQKEELKTIKIIDNNASSLADINYSEVLNPSTIKRISYLLTSLQNNLINTQSKEISFYSIERELHILLKNKTLLIFDTTGNLKEQIEKLVVFYQQKKNLKEIYLDLRITNKIFYCGYKTEYQCRKNLKKLYTKK